MTDDAAVAAALAAHRVVAIVRATDASEARQSARRLLRLGARLLEVSLTTPQAMQVLAELIGDTAARNDVVLGAGTVLDVASVHRAAEIGAKFVLSPVFDPRVVAAARAAGLAAIPGCATATEMVQAMHAGATAVKIYPASAWRPAVLRDLLSALPDLPCVPTGGVTLTSAPDWLAAGARAVGLGGDLSRSEPDVVRRTLAELQS
ncbi:bifunctional 4-hydroxy-2-oxoglutarate aldolase/2-dehydro-3-deoxy-phosphogluconate aldolase [Actinoplanes sp. CA-030573]|uniref:bifunctional 4-hydroxy-2-oxoglutarate aldolase/2-dehydro-3-deoxy-phosphogluconate aldolase n=1 Tax=Actinoplanes sp. CA-030573 TaxID=3239898 RepID=UPI003D93119E